MAASTHKTKRFSSFKGAKGVRNTFKAFKGASSPRNRSTGFRKGGGMGQPNLSLRRMSRKGR